MEMSGNMYEHAITVGNPEGRYYTGMHGNGDLDSLGNQDVYNWPGLDAIGDGRRGGNWFTYNVNNILVAYRANAAVINADRTNIYGIRGVRSVH
jgi:hypothetical protein